MCIVSCLTIFGGIKMSNKVLYEIKSLEKMIVRNFFIDSEFMRKKSEINNCEHLKLTPTQIQIIEYILKNGSEEVYQKDLENVLNLRRATVSGVLQTMEKNGLIERITDSKDSRTKKIVLNSKTKDFFERHAKKMEQIDNIITRGIDKKDLDNFSRIIDMMKDNIVSNGNRDD